jgi:hypothetical protein
MRVQFSELILRISGGIEAVHVVRKESPGEAPHSFFSMIGGSAQRWLGIWGLRECRTEPKSTLPLCGAARELFRYAP